MYAADGSISVTVVDGTTYTGLYAPDGSWNVIEAPGFGLYHPCGAYRVTTVDGTSFSGVQAPDGSWNATNADTDGATGFQHPCGAIRMSGLFSVSQLGPVLWYEASDLGSLFQDAGMTTPVTANNDPVGAFLDKSGNGFHLTQSNAALKPSYETSGGLHWVEGAGGDINIDGDVLNASGLSLSAPPYEVYLSFRLLSWLHNRFLFSLNGDIGLYFRSVQDGGIGVTGFGFGPTGDPSPNNDIYANIGVQEDVDLVFEGLVNGASSRWRFDTGSYFSGSMDDRTITSLQIPSQPGDAIVANMRLYEFILFDRSLNDTERAQLITHLAAKQGRVL